MSDSSTILGLPYLQPSQAQKHVTHNEALKALDVLVQLSALADDVTDPPSAPAEGDRYVVPAGATLEWAGQDGHIAAYQDGVWLFYPPVIGWRCYVQARNALTLWDGSAWVEPEHELLQDIDLLGIGMQATAARPFSGQMNAALWSGTYVADGGDGDMMQTLNKETAADDLGFVLQTGFQTRALIGLFGNDKLRLSVTPDGTNFNDVFVADETTGAVEMPTLPRFKAYTNYDNYITENVWSKVGINTVEYNDQNVFDPVTNLFTAPVTGTYMLGATAQFKIHMSSLSRMRGRLVKNGTDVIRGSFGEFTGGHLTEATSMWLQTMAYLTAGDTVEFQGYVRTDDCYFAAEQTSFWGHKVG